MLLLLCCSFALRFASDASLLGLGPRGDRQDPGSAQAPRREDTAQGPPLDLRRRLRREASGRAVVRASLIDALVPRLEAKPGAFKFKARGFTV